MRGARFVIRNFAILASLPLAAVESTAAEGMPAFEKRLYESSLRRTLREEPVRMEFVCLPVGETLYHPQDVSPAGAQGLWQIMAQTGSRYGLRQTGEFDDREHGEKSTRAAARYLGDVRRLFGDWLLGTGSLQRR